MTQKIENGSATPASQRTLTDRLAHSPAIKKLWYIALGPAVLLSGMLAMASTASLADEVANKFPVQIAQADYSAFVGTWEGKSPQGVAIKLVVPDDVAAGGQVRFWLKGKEQAPCTPHLQGDTIKLSDSSGNDRIIGPVNGHSMPYKWVKKGGATTMQTTLTRG